MKSQELLNIIKYGTVTEIKADTAQVKVAFKESGDVVSYYMPVLQSFAGKNNAYIMPSVDDTVVCLISPRGEAGVVVGSIYTGINKPLITDENKYNITFEDESSIEYDKKENLLKADIKGSAEIVIDKSITITITEDKEISAKNIKITAESEINIECKTANIKADSEANIEAGTVNLKGNKVNVGENAARGILHEGLLTWLSSHTHKGNQGAPTSTPINPPIKGSCVSNTCKVSS